MRAAVGEIATWRSLLQRVVDEYSFRRTCELIWYASDSGRNRDSEIAPTEDCGKIVV